MDTIIPQNIFSIYGIIVSSTVISTWIMMFIVLSLIALLNIINQDFLGMLVEFISNLISSIMNLHDVEMFLPILGSLAIFIASANIMGSFPILSSPTSDINTPVALAIVVFFSVHWYGIKIKGLIKYFKEFASPIFLLPLEIVGQFSRTLSLSLRLFGNILSTDLVVAIVMSIIPILLPQLIMGLGLITSLLQAYIFTALASVYIASAIESN